MSDQKKILIIDDEIDLCELIGFQFNAEGYHVEMANDGVQGLEKLKNFTPHVIILDMNMPNMGGIEFYAKICDENNKPICPVFVLTARANVEQLFRDVDVDGFMTKPFEIKQLFLEVDAIVKRQRRLVAEKDAGEEGPKRILIAEDKPDVADQLKAVLEEALYKVDVTPTGMMAIQHILDNPPDLVLLKMELLDMSGDMAIFKLRLMAKSMKVNFVLYTKKNVDYNRTVLEKIGSKSSVLELVEYDKPEDFIDIVDHAFEKIEEEFQPDEDDEM